MKMGFEEGEYALFAKFFFEMLTSWKLTYNQLTKQRNYLGHGYTDTV